MTSIRISGITDSVIDGIGMSLNIFFQGCTMNCKGCQNPDLQPPDGGYETETSYIANYIKPRESFYDSVVFTGGDPLEQLTAVLDLVKRVRYTLNLKTVLYTGRVYSSTPKMISREFDIIVDGKYVEDLATGSFPASSNQKVIYKHKDDFDLFMRNKRPVAPIEAKPLHHVSVMQVFGDEVGRPTLQGRVVHNGKSLS